MSVGDLFPANVKEVKMKRNLDWKDSIVGRLEKFLFERHKVNPLWCRILGTTIVSAALGKVNPDNLSGTRRRFYISDQLGDVDA